MVRADYTTTSSDPDWNQLQEEIDGTGITVTVGGRISGTGLEGDTEADQVDNSSWGGLSVNPLPVVLIALGVLAGAIGAAAASVSKAKSESYATRLEKAKAMARANMQADAAVHPGASVQDYEPRARQAPVTGEMGGRSSAIGNAEEMEKAVASRQQAPETSVDDDGFYVPAGGYNYDSGGGKVYPVADNDGSASGEDYRYF
jgi:hypothetical protein